MFFIIDMTKIIFINIMKNNINNAIIINKNAINIAPLTVFGQPAPKFS